MTSKRLSSTPVIHTCIHPSIYATQYPIFFSFPLSLVLVPPPGAVTNTPRRQASFGGNLDAVSALLPLFLYFLLPIACIE